METDPLDADAGYANNQFKMKSKASSKCPACKGTGTYLPPPTYPPKRTSDVPRYKCTECDGTGKAQHFEMMFWHYDQFPFILASRGFLRDDGTAYCPSYNACFRPVKIMSLKDGKAFAAQLEELTKERKVMFETLEKSYRIRLRQIAPWAIKNSG